MAELFSLHSVSPQVRLVGQIVRAIKQGEIIALPTDACYVLACHLDDKDAVTRMRRIRQLDDKHHLTLMCADLAKVSHYAQVNNAHYRLLKRATPGAFTFILPANKEVPRRVSHPQRKTIGLRVPAHAIVQSLLTELDDALLCTTLQLPKDDFPLNDVDEILQALKHDVAIVVEAGSCGLTPTTLVDLTTEEMVIIREGCGDVSLLGAV